MRIEIRGDTAQISGYVNVTEKKSRPVITPHGKVVEEIEPRAFQNAFHRNLLSGMRSNFFMGKEKALVLGV